MPPVEAPTVAPQPTTQPEDKKSVVGFIYPPPEVRSILFAW